MFDTVNIEASLHIHTMTREELLALKTGQEVFRFVLFYDSIFFERHIVLARPRTMRGWARRNPDVRTALRRQAHTSAFVAQLHDHDTDEDEDVMRARLNAEASKVENYGPHLRKYLAETMMLVPEVSTGTIRTRQSWHRRNLPDLLIESKETYPHYKRRPRPRNLREAIASGKPAGNGEYTVFGTDTIDGLSHVGSYIGGPYSKHGAVGSMRELEELARRYFLTDYGWKLRQAIGRLEESDRAYDQWDDPVDMDMDEEVEA